MTMAAAPHNPPFRAEHIGSLLRPPALLALRARRDRGEIDDAALRAAEDKWIGEAVALQLALGLSSITDGEYRRHAYSDSFTTDAFDGLSIGATMDGNWTYSDSGGKTTEGRVPKVVGRLRLTRPINVENFRFLAAQARAGLPKITLPGPCYIHFRAGRDNISRTAYPTLDPFWQDLVDAYRTEIAALYDAGCRYVQLDETSIAKLGDPKIREGLAKRGDDWATLLELYTDVINEIAAATPPDLHLGMHLCRGNNQGKWLGEGGYDYVAERLFNELDLDFYCMEYDSPRAGSFAPLRFVPKDKVIVLGLISSKVPALERPDDLKKRIDEAAVHVDLARLALSPQCGFASTAPGNPITPAVQKAKLELVVEVAKAVWS
jgi:5-methyltetrahydropteroyltriglutamate--homocysteine methyltransferase